MFVVAIIAFIVLLLTGVIKFDLSQKKGEVGYNLSDCQITCNKTYNNSGTDELLICIDNCKKFGTKGNAYANYFENLNDIKNNNT